MRNIKKKLPASPRKILVIRTDRIGDVVLSTPVLTALRGHYPNAVVSMMVRPYTYDLISHHPHVDHIFIDDVDGKHKGIVGFFRLVKALRKQKFDLVFVLHPTLRLALLVKMADISYRIGTGYRAYSFLFNRRIYLHRKNAGRHELDLNLDMLRAVGITMERVQFYLKVPEDAEVRVRMLLKDKGIDGLQPFVVLHPGSGGSAMDWPVTNFATLAEWIHKRCHIPVVVTGHNTERTLVDQMCQNAAVPVIRMDGMLNIKELLALLKFANVLVANSTGPLHMAVAMGTEVVGLFCPLVACSPVRWGPYNQQDAVVMPDLPQCVTCDTNKCTRGNCMELISVQEVFARVELQLAKHN